MKPAYFKYLLEEEGKFLKGVAEKTGYTPGYVSLVLRRKRRNRKIERALARAIGRPVAEVFPDNIPLKTAA